MKMKQSILFLIALLFCFSGISQDLSQQANDCFESGDYACAEIKYEASYKLAKQSEKQITEIKIQIAKWCLEKLTSANNEFAANNYTSAKEIYQELLNTNFNDNFAKSQIEKCNLFIEKATIKTLSISSSNLFFNPDANSKNIDVITNSKFYTIERDDLPDWLSVTIHLDYVTVSCEQNKKRKSRGGEFVIKAGPWSRIINVTQEGKKKIKYVSPEVLSYEQISTPFDTQKENKNNASNTKSDLKKTNNVYSASKSGFDMGFGFSTDETDITINFDFEIKNNYWIGAQANVSLGGDIVGENYTDTIGINEYSEDIYELANNSWAIGLRVGKEISNKIKIVGALGMAIEYEAQNRYDEFTILGNNGYYHVKTGNRENSLYAAINCNVTIAKWFAIEGGFGTRGFEFKGIIKI